MNSQNKLEKFFTRGDNVYITGAALLVVGLFSIWIGASFTFILFIIGLVCAPTGLLLFLLGSIGRIGHEDIDKAVSDRLWNYDKSLIEDPHIGKRITQHYKPVIIKQFDFEGKDLRAKKGKDGAWRTSQYTAVKILFLKDALALIRKTISVLSDDNNGGSETEKAEYKYSDLASAEIIRDRLRLNNLKHSLEVKRARLKITATDGKTVLFVQINDDIESDQLAESINKLIRNGSAD